MMPTRLFFMSALLLGLAGCRPAAYTSGGYPEPERFEKAIQAFEAQDKNAMPKPGGVVCVGSSSMRFWKDRLAEDLMPLSVVPRGFGGSNMHDVLHYADRIVLRYKPRAVLLYEGDNDIATRIPPSRVHKTFLRLVKKIHKAAPDCRVYVLAIKPSPKRWHLWDKMAYTNKLLVKACAEDDRLTYIDIATPMLGVDGKPRPELFTKDRLHMNDAGYDAWRDAVRPVLVEAEREHESGH